MNKPQSWYVYVLLSLASRALLWPFVVALVYAFGIRSEIPCQMNFRLMHGSCLWLSPAINGLSVPSVLGIKHQLLLSFFRRFRFGHAVSTVCVLCVVCYAIELHTMHANDSIAVVLGRTSRRTFYVFVISGGIGSHYAVFYDTRHF